MLNTWHQDQINSRAAVAEAMEPDAVMTSVAVLAEISLRSARKLFIIIFKKYIYRIKEFKT